MPVARWIGGAFILALILFSLVVLAVFINDTAPGGALQAASIPATALLIAAECYWLYAFACSAATRRYVARVDA